MNTRRGRLPMSLELVGLAMHEYNVLSKFPTMGPSTTVCAF